MQTPAVQTTEVANGQGAGQELDDDIPDTLEGYPAFKKIVAEARAIFGTKISMLTVLVSRGSCSTRLALKCIGG